MSAATTLARDALKYHMEQTRPIQRTIDAIAALEAVQTAEPVAWLVKNCVVRHTSLQSAQTYCDVVNRHPDVLNYEFVSPIAVYATPQQAAAPEWIPISERLPEYHQSVALLSMDRTENVAGFWSRQVQAAGYLSESLDFDYWSVGAEGLCLDAFTHWTPLPASTKATS